MSNENDEQKEEVGFPSKRREEEVGSLKKTKKGKNVGGVLTPRCLF
jgi:hypothetical protein